VLNLGRVYVRYFNDRYARSGALWERRFHSCLVDSADYVLNCYRYIERNPVRAAMVAEASAFAWSSRGSNAGTADDPAIKPHPVYTALAEDQQSRRAAYKSFCSGDEPGAFLTAIREATYTGYPLVGRRRTPRRLALRNCYSDPEFSGRPVPARRSSSGRPRSPGCRGPWSCGNT
jgi:putative transposase